MNESSCPFSWSSSSDDVQSPPFYWGVTKACCCSRTCICDYLTGEGVPSQSSSYASRGIFYWWLLIFIGSFTSLSEWYDTLSLTRLASDLLDTIFNVSFLVSMCLLSAITSSIILFKKSPPLSAPDVEVNCFFECKTIPPLPPTCFLGAGIGWYISEWTRCGSDICSWTFN